MQAVTLGLGPYSRTAVLAGARVREMTGLEVLVIDDGMTGHLDYPHPGLVKLHVFDFATADSVLYFDSDMVMLRPWDPSVYSGSAEFVAVADQFIDQYPYERDVAWASYVNAGLFIADRAHHRPVLELARAIWRDADPPLPLADQSALNRALHDTGTPVRLLGEEFNYLRYHLRHPVGVEEPYVAHYTPYGIELAHARLLKLLTG
jgi:hypothetical protein